MSSYYGNCHGILLSQKPYSCSVSYLHVSFIYDAPIAFDEFVSTCVFCELIHRRIIIYSYTLIWWNLSFLAAYIKLI